MFDRVLFTGQSLLVSYLVYEYVINDSMVHALVALLVSVLVIGISIARAAK